MATITLSPGIAFGSLSASIPSFLGSSSVGLGKAGEFYAEVTDAGREYLARTHAEGLAFKIISFSVGTAGYVPTNPTYAISVDTTLTNLQAPVFSDTIDLVEEPNDIGRSFYCRLQPSEANYGLGEIGLWAEIVHSPELPSEVGTTFLFALANMPLQSKNEDFTFVWRVVVQL